MKRFLWILILGLSFAGCTSDSVDDAGESDADVSETDTGETPPETTWLTPPEGCSAPANLPGDPLVVIPETGGNGGFGGGGCSVAGAGRALNIHNFVKFCEYSLKIFDVQIQINKDRKS